MRSCCVGHYLENPVTSVSNEGVVLNDGSTIDSDVVLLAAGVIPNTDLAAEAGLLLDNGVVVDQYLLTNDDSISAMGDCAAFPNPFAGLPIRLECIQAATDHAKTIARRLVTNIKTPYTAVPWFWSDQADWKFQIAGLATHADNNVETEEGTVMRFSANTLSAVETINNAKIHMLARKILAGPLVIQDKLAALNYDLAAL